MPFVTLTLWKGRLACFIKKMIAEYIRRTNALADDIALAQNASEPVNECN